MPTPQALAAQCVKRHRGSHKRRRTGARASLRGVCPVPRPGLISADMGRSLTGPRSVPGCLRPAWNKPLPQPLRQRGFTVCPRGQALPRRPLRSAPAGDETRDAGRGSKYERRNTLIKKRITTLYPRDIRALGALARCGHVAENQLKQAGLRDKRIVSYQKDGLVERSISCQLFSVQMKLFQTSVLNLHF